MGFTGKRQTVTFGGTAVADVESVDFTDEGNESVKEAAGQTVVIGDIALRSQTATMNLVVNHNDVTKMNAFVPGTAAAFNWKMTPDTGDAQVDSSEVLVTSRSFSAPSNGKRTMTVNLRFNSPAVISAIS